MGMSASQVRYLTLTARIHDVENEAQRIQNQKLLLANDSDAVYQRYLDALNKTKIQVRQFNDDSGVSQMVDVTLDVLYRDSCTSMTNGYALTGIDGSVYLPFNLSVTACESYDNFEQAFANYFYNGASDSVTQLHNNAQQTSYVKAMWRYINEQAGTEMGAAPNSGWFYVSDDSRIQMLDDEYYYYENNVLDHTAADLRHEVIHCIVDESKADTNWIRDIIGYGYANFQMLSSDVSDLNINTGLYDIETLSGTTWESADVLSMNYLASSTVATDTQMGEAADDIELAVAEVEYESDMKKINAKDKKYDTELSTLENQRSAMKEEMDSLKTVINDNIQRTFKLFS